MCGHERGLRARCGKTTPARRVLARTRAVWATTEAAQMKKTDAEELERRMANDEVVVVNVLPASKYEAAHIPGTLNADLASDDFVSRVKRFAGGDQRQPVVVYCGGPRCDASARAVEQLTGAGFTDVARYEGGMEDWQQQGHEVASSMGAG
jgi:rhodanese-related sulfurtransferase